MTAKVVTSDTGTATAGTRVARPLRRNTNTTSTTSTTETSIDRSISCSEARMVVVRSSTTSTSMPAGTVARNIGSKVFTASMVSMMLAPGWRNTWSWTAGLPLVRPRL